MISRVRAHLSHTGPGGKPARFVALGNFDCRRIEQCDGILLVGRRRQREREPGQSLPLSSRYSVISVTPRDYRFVRPHMSRRAGLLFALVLLVAGAHADNSIVIGHGIKVDGVYESAGDWVSGYVWLINARRTVSGPVVKGKVRIIAASHAQPRDSYLKTVELFVLTPVIGDGAESNDEPRFSLVASSPLYRSDKYCIPFKPSEISIPLNDTEVERDEYDAYCFSKQALLKAVKRTGHSHAFHPINDPAPGSLHQRSTDEDDMRACHVMHPRVAHAGFLYTAQKAAACRGCCRS